MMGGEGGGGGRGGLQGSLSRPRPKTPRKCTGKEGPKERKCGRWKEEGRKMREKGRKLRKREGR